MSVLLMRAIAQQEREEATTGALGEGLEERVDRLSAEVASLKAQLARVDES